MRGADDPTRRLSSRAWTGPQTTAEGAQLDPGAARGARGLDPALSFNARNRRRDPSVSTVERLAKAFGCAAGELLGSVLGMSPAAVEIGRMYDAAPSEVQEGVAQILRATARKRR